MVGVLFSMMATGWRHARQTSPVRGTSVIYGLGLPVSSPCRKKWHLGHLRITEVSLCCLMKVKQDGQMTKVVGHSVRADMSRIVCLRAGPTCLGLDTLGAWGCGLRTSTTTRDSSVCCVAASHAPRVRHGPWAGARCARTFGTRSGPRRRAVPARTRWYGRNSWGTGFAPTCGGSYS